MIAGLIRPPLSAYDFAVLDRLGTWRAVATLALLLAASSVVVAVLGGALIDFKKGSDRGFWIGFLLGAAALLLLGLWVASRSRWGGVVLLAVGGILGSLVTFWTIVYPLAAIVLVVLAVVWATRSGPTAQATV